MSDEKHALYPDAEATSIEREEIHLNRLARRIMYLKGKAEELAIEGKQNKYELAEMNATKWAFNIALSAHRNNKRFFNYLVRKFPQKEDKS